MRKDRVGDSKSRIQQDCIEGTEGRCQFQNLQGQNTDRERRYTMKPQKAGLTIDIQVSELAGYMFFIDGKQIQFEDMSREQQIKVLNSLSQGYRLFERFLKAE